MNFRIQASYPINNGDFCQEDTKLSEAIETIFPMLTEDAILIWNTIYIPLNYKYDISYMIDDILNLLKKIRENLDGEIKIDWPSNSFACEWILKWNSELLTIDSKWRSVTGHTEDSLNNLSELNVNLVEFVNEWKSVLEVLINNLESCGYGKENLIDMGLLYDEYRAIKSYGLLYLQRKN